MNSAEMIAENLRRNAARQVEYDPATGRGCTGERVRLLTADGVIFAPPALVADPVWNKSLSGVALDRLRCRHDFEFWAWRCARIRHKLTGEDVEFVLNRPQRRLLDVMERMRLADEPIRVILLKARQWGGSTLVQLYMAWIQIVHRRNWHSIICAHVKDSSANIRGIYSKLLDNYPREMWDEEEAPRFSAFERSINTRMIEGRGCKVTVGSCENPEASRGSDIAMAHLSEVAFWRSSRLHEPREMVQAVLGGVAYMPGSLVVMESTANGVGSFFHQEWLRAENGDSAFEPVFVPWHEIDIYSRELADPAAFAASLTPAEQAMWQSGLTLEQIAWYRLKLSEIGCPRRMMSEYPASPVEAFANTGAGVFPAAAVENLRQECSHMADDGDGLVTWVRPEEGEEYVVAVDVGGRSAGSDYSVIAVLRASGLRPEVCAQWRGHSDYDLLARRAAEIARRYNTALLVIESNSPENLSARTGEPSVLLDVLGDSYPNFYRRPAPSGDRLSTRPGFHMNRETKAAVVANMQRVVRDGAYVEHDHGALDEMITYEQLPDGSWAARSGCHDDILITRAIALYVIARRPAPTPLIDYSVFAPARMTA